MNSLSAECKRHKEVGLGRPPRPRENADITIYVIKTCDYVINRNTWDIVEGDKITIDFVFNEKWSKHTDRKCAISIDDRVEVIDLVEDRLVIPRHMVVNHDIRLLLKGFFVSENGCRLINGHFIAGDVVDSDLTRRLNRNFIVTDSFEQKMSKAKIVQGADGHILISDSRIQQRPGEYDRPYSEDNLRGYIEIDMFETPIKIGSWYDR